MAVTFFTVLPFMQTIVDFFAAALALGVGEGVAAGVGVTTVSLFA